MYELKPQEYVQMAKKRVRLNSGQQDQNSQIQQENALIEGKKKRQKVSNYEETKEN